ncbi:MAG: diaminopimelate epimerase [Clostridia bacterium]|nr:diaminopimelate epimerase [Clostridia bacterium]
MKFTKMHGIGNDFIMVDGFTEQVNDYSRAAAKLCRRNFAVGADGIIVVGPSNCADARMRVINSDGSDAEMCGNGLRCAALFLKMLGRAPSDTIVFETDAGLLTAVINGNNVTVDMGAAILNPAQIPVNAASNQIEIELDGVIRHFYCVSMGNPHAVTFDFYPEGKDFLRLGNLMEHHPIFPAKANIEFCHVDDSGISVRVWERGDGPTLACGTGACAVFTAAENLGLCGSETNIHLPGGTLLIRHGENGHVFMEGPAEAVFTGETIENY